MTGGRPAHALPPRPHRGGALHGRGLASTEGPLSPDAPTQAAPTRFVQYGVLLRGRPDDLKAFLENLWQEASVSRVVVVQVKGPMSARTLRIEGGR